MLPDLSLIAFASAVLLLAGTVKGLLGIGMPTVALALLTLQLDARPAVALILVPMLFANVWQFWRGPDMARCVRTHWRFAVVLMVFVAATVWISQDAPDRVLRAVLGTFILIFCLMSWRDAVPKIPSHRVRSFEFLSAVVSGLVGGLTAAWAPPMVAYLTGLRLDRDDFVQTLGLLITAGSIALVVAYPSVGHVSGPDLVVSAGLLIPTLIGFAAGEHLRKRLNAEKFKAVFLIGFAIMGANLLGRALFGG